MSTLRRFLKRFMAVLEEKGGFTLVEVTAVTAIMGALAVIAVPIALDKIDQSKQTAMAGDTKNIATALVNLIEDVGLTKLGDPDADDGTGGDAIVMLVLEGPGTIPLDSDGTGDYDAATSIWSSVDSVALARATDIGEIRNHLVENDGNDNDTPNEAGDYTNWAGPYLTEAVADPFGNRYLALIQGIREGTQQGAALLVYGWVISSGENLMLETDDATSTLGGDDVGIMLFRNQ